MELENVGIAILLQPHSDQVYPNEASSTTFNPRELARHNQVE